MEQKDFPTTLNEKLLDFVLFYIWMEKSNEKTNKTLKAKSD